MTLQASIARFDSLLKAAVRCNDKDQIALCIERLKTLLFEAYRQNDVAACNQIVKSIGGRGEGYELLHDVTPVLDDNAQVWQFRADASTARLTRRLLRDTPPDIGMNDDAANPVDRVLEALRGCNTGHMSNSALAHMLGLDASVISRTLQKLAAHGLVRQWRSGKFVMNVLTDRGRGIVMSAISTYTSGRMQAAQIGQLKPKPEQPVEMMKRSIKPTSLPETMALQLTERQPTTTLKFQDVEDDPTQPGNEKSSRQRSANQKSKVNRSQFLLPVAEQIRFIDEKFFTAKSTDPHGTSLEFMKNG